MGGKLGESVAALTDQFNKSQKEYKINAVFKGSYRNADRRGRGLPRQAGPAHRAGLRGRYRHHDGGQGCGLSGLSAHGDAKEPFDPRPSSPSTATTRRPMASCSPCRSTPPRRCSTGTRRCFKRPDSTLIPHPRPGRRGRSSQEADRLGCQVRPCVEWQTWVLLENYGAWHNLPFATKANGFGGTDIELKFNDEPRSS